MRTAFNGFGVAAKEIVEDEPMASLYGDVVEDAREIAVKHRP
jgi:hypothetical protein